MKIIKMISIADVFTLVNALFGFSAILLVISGDPVHAVYAILMGILCDGLDGLVARRFARKWYFGDYLDIMSDTTSFCVAPAVLVFTTQKGNFHSLAGPYSDIIIYISCAVSVACGLLRLARFCYQGGGSHTTFTGLASPGSALVISLLVLQGIISTTPIPSFILVISTVVLAVLMISDFRYPKVRGAYAVVSGVVIFIVMLTDSLGNRNVSEYMLDVALLLALAYVVFGPAYVRWRVQDGQGKKALPVHGHREGRV